MTHCHETQILIPDMQAQVQLHLAECSLQLAPELTPAAACSCSLQLAACSLQLAAPAAIPAAAAGNPSCSSKNEGNPC